jgi:hypothetical protein
MMVPGIEAVLAPLEESAELERLVGLVRVHGPEVEAGDAEGKSAEKGEKEEPPEDLIGHLPGRP